VTVRGLLLAPGAGSDRNQSTLVAVEGGLAPLPVHRFDFPYRREGRRAPDRPEKLVATVVDEVEAVAARLGCAPAELVLGGRSMGGRMCSMAVAQGLPAAGLVLISYPLHPPGRPDRMRTEHLPALECPCLFVSGTSDAFGSPPELEDATAAIPGTVTHAWIDGGRHELRGADQRVAEIVDDWLAAL
jgi:predicted alpha/beta-hydrolase family hydrolase